jgi:hypothetical protein
MRTVIIGFSRPKRFWAPFSWAIRAVDGFTPYSHTYIRVRAEKYDRDLIYQASHTLVNFMGKPAFDDEALVIREFPIQISDETMTKVMQFAIDNAGQPYDLKSVFGIALIKIARLFGRRLTVNPLGDGHGFFCSELVGAILVELIGTRLYLTLSTMTPRDIYEALASMPQPEAA